MALKLIRLGISNFRSIEGATLDGLREFNVLIGRNNSGKSSVIDAVARLAELVSSTPSDVVDWSSIPTHRDAARRIELVLTLKVDDAERARLLDLLARVTVPEERIDQLRNSAFARLLEFTFTSVPGNASLLHLRQTRVRGEDDHWGVVQLMNPAEELGGNPPSTLVAIDDLARTGVLTGGAIAPGRGPQVSVRFQPQLRASIAVMNMSAATRWPYELVVDYLSRAFFFTPFRHSESRLPVEAQTQLARDGRNLAQVLHTLQSNDRPHFAQVEEFVRSAIPDLGILQTPLFVKDTEVGFRPERQDYVVALHSMGGGIEQLLMIAVLLATTDRSSPLFLEEPESHLHPSAQRFLIERLYRDGRQVFLSTHSPLFLNVPGTRSVYRVELVSGITRLTPINDTEELGRVLDDIGVRNSDVLLSDAVLFVEGPSDRDTFVNIGRTLGLSLLDHNVNVVPMGGGQLEGNPSLRSVVLEKISNRAPIPHMIVIDRDERPRRIVDDLQGKLGTRIHVLQRRELENYLLVPRAVMSALSVKYRDSADILERVAALGEDGIAKRITQVAADLRGVVLVKRIRAELGGLREGILPRASMGTLAMKAQDESLADLLVAEANNTLSAHLERTHVQEVVAQCRSELDADWAKPEVRLDIAPGSELLEQLYTDVGGVFEKEVDSPRIAAELTKSEIGSELTDLLRKAVALGTPAGG